MFVVVHIFNFVVIAVVWLEVEWHFFVVIAVVWLEVEWHFFFSSPRWSSSCMSKLWIYTFDSNTFRLFFKVHETKNSYLILLRRSKCQRLNRNQVSFQGGLVCFNFWVSSFFFPDLLWSSRILSERCENFGNWRGSSSGELWVCWWVVFVLFSSFESLLLGPYTFFLPKLLLQVTNFRYGSWSGWGNHAWLVHVVERRTVVWKVEGRVLH